MSRRPRIPLLAPFTLIATLFARLSAVLALQPATLPSKHWPRAAAVRVAAVLLLAAATALLLATTVRTGLIVPVARWVFH